MIPNNYNENSGKKGSVSLLSVPVASCLATIMVTYIQVFKIYPCYSCSLVITHPVELVHRPSLDTLLSLARLEASMTPLRP